MQLQVKKLAPDAILPTRGSADSAGLDLYAAEDAGIPSGSSVAVRTGISAAIPQGCVGKLYIRSGHARKWRLGLVNSVGIIDADYRGEIVAVVENKGRKPYLIRKGERFCQLVIQEYVHTDVVEVSELDETVRDTGGFGSTG